MANNSIKKMVELAVNITAKGFEKSGTTINGLATRLKTATEWAGRLSKALGMNGLGGTIRQLTGLTAALGGVFTLTSKQIKSLAKAFVDKGSSIKEVKDAIEITAGSINDYKQQIKSLDEQINNSKIGSKQYNELLKERIRLVGLLNAAEAQKREQIGKSSRVIDSQAQKEKELIAQQKKWAKEQDADALKRRNQRKEQIAQRQALLNGGTAQVAQDEQISSSTNKKAKATMGFSERIQTAIKWVGAYFVAGQAFLQIQRLLTFLFIDSIRAFVKYEDELKKLQAITGASAEEVDELSNAAINLAKATIFTSTEIIELQKQLAKLGFSVSEIKDAQAGIAAFAQVTGVSIEQSAELVGKAIRAFNLSASSSQRIVNTFITGINKSALSGEYLATSMQYVASIGDQLNASVEMVTASLGILANAGFTASRAGTGLRLIFTEVGSAGEDLTETMRRLKEENISLSEAKELVGQRGAGALLTLINRYEEINALVEESSNLTAKFSAELTALSSELSAWKQLGVVIGEGNKSFGEALYNLLRINEVVLNIIDAIENGPWKTLGLKINESLGLERLYALLGVQKQLSAEFSSMASSRLRLAKLVSMLSSDEKEQLLDIENSEERILELIDGHVDSLRVEGKLTKEQARELKDVYSNRVNIVKIIKEESEAIDSIKKQEDERKRSLGVMSDELEGILSSSISYEDMVGQIDDKFKGHQNKLKDINIQIDTNSKSIQILSGHEGELAEKNAHRIEQLKEQNALLKGQAEAIKQIINRFTDVEVLEEFAKRHLHTRKAFQDEILKKEKEIKKLQNQQGLTADEKERIINLTKEVDVLKELEEAYWGVSKSKKENDDKIKSFTDFYNAQQKFIEQIRIKTEAARADEMGYTPLIPFDRGEYEEAKKEYDEALKYLAALPDSVKKEYDNFANTMIAINADALNSDFNKEMSKMSAENIKNLFGLDIEELTFEVENGIRNAGEAFFFAMESIEVAEELLNRLSLSPEEREAIISSLKQMAEDIKKAQKEIKFDDQKDKPTNFLYKSLGLDIDDKEFKEIVQAAKRMANEAVNAIIDSANSRLDAEQRAVDARYSYEEKRYKSMLDANIINQQQYEKKIEKLEKERLNKTNEIEKKRFNNEKAQSIAQAAINTAVAVTRMLADGKSFAIPLVIALGAIQASIIAAQKFVPTQFEKGGVVEGRSHAEGGVPFTVRGRGGYEMEGGEFIVNKKATQKNLPLLEQINAGATTVSSRPMRESKSKYADGGMVGGDMTMLLAEIRNELKRPVRAYVSERELIGKMNERVDIKKRSAR